MRERENKSQFVFISASLKSDFVHYVDFKLKFKEFASMSRIKILVFVLFYIALSASFECGVRKVPHRTRRMANGEQSYPGQWPWFAALHTKMQRGPDRFFSAASIINEWTLITSESGI